MSKNKHVVIYTDGACKGNPGPGGWAAILTYNGNRKELSGYEPHTTNNRMELTGVIEGLKALKEPCDVTIVSDSKYVCDAMTKEWVKVWSWKNWMKTQNKPVPNADLWKQILDLQITHNLTFEWVKGHNGHPENERCDELAVNEYVSRVGG